MYQEMKRNVWHLIVVTRFIDTSKTPELFLLGITMKYNDTRHFPRIRMSSLGTWSDACATVAAADPEEGGLGKK